MAIQDILNSNFILFGGKGGVGKTTCAAAIAVALCLLSMPEIFDEWINTFYHFRDKHRVHERAFSQPDRADQFLVSLKTSTDKLRNLLRSKTTEFVVVTAAERMVLEETRDLVEHLKTYGIAVRHMIINRARRDQEQKLLQVIRNTFSQLEIIEVDLYPAEPSGIENLRRFASVLYG